MTTYTALGEKWKIVLKNNNSASLLIAPLVVNGGLINFRLLLSSAAYILIESIRRVALNGTKLAHAQVDTSRLKLFKIGTVILRNTRRIRLFFSSAYAYRDLFLNVLSRINST